MGTPEGEIKRKIRKYLESNGIFYMSVGEGAYSTPGIPDIVLVIDGRFVGFEVKTYNGSQRPLQRKFQERLEDAGGKYYIIRSMKDVEDALSDVCGNTTV